LGFPKQEISGFGTTIKDSAFAAVSFFVYVKAVSEYCVVKRMELPIHLLMLLADNRC